MKSAVTAALLLFVAGSVVFLVVTEIRRPDAKEAPFPPREAQTEQGADASRSPTAGESLAQVAPATVTAYYFHGTMRCPTCLKMERYAREAIEEAFAAEIDAGLLKWQALNYDEPANEHFIMDYGLTASALVVVSGADGAGPSWR